MARAAKQPLTPALPEPEPKPYSNPTLTLTLAPTASPQPLTPNPCAGARHQAAGRRRARRAARAARPGAHAPARARALPLPPPLPLPKACTSLLELEPLFSLAWDAQLWHASLAILDFAQPYLAYPEYVRAALHHVLAPQPATDADGASAGVKALSWHALTPLTLALGPALNPHP